jgi:hypothetical protein
VDTFWHFHILDTVKYAADCERVFGYFLHHNPYIGLRGGGDEEVLRQYGERMRELYEATFDQPYSISATAYSAGQVRQARAATEKKPAYCAATAAGSYSAAATLKGSYCAAPALKVSHDAALPMNASACAAASRQLLTC